MKLSELVSRQPSKILVILFSLMVVHCRHDATPTPTEDGAAYSVSGRVSGQRGGTGNYNENSKSIRRAVADGSYAISNPLTVTKFNNHLYVYAERSSEDGPILKATAQTHDRVIADLNTTSDYDLRVQFKSKGSIFLTEGAQVHFKFSLELGPRTLASRHIEKVYHARLDANNPDKILVLDGSSPVPVVEFPNGGNYEFSFIESTASVLHSGLNNTEFTVEISADLDRSNVGGSAMVNAESAFELK
ncbi:MAG: hypothetical protein ACU833_04500 [Gammaproteobacteria bacterium]